MENILYTLNDSVFRYGLAKGSDSERFFEDNRKIMVVGGAASQLNMRDNSDLLRPTTDIDLISNDASKKSQRRNWAEFLEREITKEGHFTKGGLTRYGAEVRFSNYEPDFILHLNCFGDNFFKRHKKRMDGEYERSETVKIDNSEVKYHSPMDVIINKIRRIKSLEKAKAIKLNSYQRGIMHSICNAQFDDINTEGLHKDLENLLKVRNQTVEDLGRYGYKQVISEVENYKLMKDLYDIHGLIDSCRTKNKKISKKEFREALELALKP